MRRHVARNTGARRRAAKGRGVLTRRIRDAVKSHRRGEAEGDIARSKEVAKEIAKEAKALAQLKDALDDAVGSLGSVLRS